MKLHMCLIKQIQKEVKNKRVWIEKDWHQHDVVVKSAKGEISCALLLPVKSLCEILYHYHGRK